MSFISLFRPKDDQLVGWCLVENLSLFTAKLQIIIPLIYAFKSISDGCFFQVLTFPNRIRSAVASFFAEDQIIASTEFASLPPSF